MTVICTWTKKKSVALQSINWSAPTVTVSVYYTLRPEALCSKRFGQVVIVTRDLRCLVPRQAWYSFYRPRRHEGTIEPFENGKWELDNNHFYNLRSSLNSGEKYIFIFQIYQLDTQSNIQKILWSFILDTDKVYFLNSGSLTKIRWTKPKLKPTRFRD